MQLTSAFKVLLAFFCLEKVHGLLGDVTDIVIDKVEVPEILSLEALVQLGLLTEDALLDLGVCADISLLGLDLDVDADLQVYLSLLGIGLDKSVLNLLKLTCEDPKAPKYCYDPTNSSCGPPVWARLPFENNQCGGMRNSPIEITSTDSCVPMKYEFNPGTCTWGDLHYKINDHSIKAEYPSPLCCERPTFSVGGLTYEMLQFHIHLGQEHSVDGEFASASLHMVHALKSCPAGRSAEPFAVIGFGMKSGTEVGDNEPVLDRVLSGFVEVSKAAMNKCFEDCNGCGEDPKDHFFWEGVEASHSMADPYAMLPEGASFYQYLGGLTTPPCSEVVFWNFLSEYIPFSVAQADTINRLVLGYLDDECKMGTVADPKTANTSRPPIAPGNRPVVKVGMC
jgi:carbonic anhydrase